MKDMIRYIKTKDYQSKTLRNSSMTVFINGITGIGKLLLGIYYFSDWFVVSAIYYIALAAAKGQMLKRYHSICQVQDAKKQKEKELKLFKESGIFQCVIGLSYFFVSLHTLLVGDTVTYPGYMVYLVAIISFAKIGFAVFGYIQTRRIKSPVISALKIIDFTDALVSLVVTRSVFQIMKGAEFAVESTGILGMMCSILFMALGAIILGYKKTTPDTTQR